MRQQLTGQVGSREGFSCGKNNEGYFEWSRREEGNDDIGECQNFGTKMLNRLEEISSHFIMFIIIFLIKDSILYPLICKLIF